METILEIFTRSGKLVLWRDECIFYCASFYHVEYPVVYHHCFFHLHYSPRSADIDGAVPFDPELDSVGADDESENHAGPYYSTLKARSHVCPHLDCIKAYVSAKLLRRHLERYPSHNLRQVSIQAKGGDADAAGKSAATAAEIKIAAAVEKSAVAAEKIDAAVARNSTASADEAVAIRPARVTIASHDSKTTENRNGSTEEAKRRRLEEVRASNLRKNLVRHAVSKCTDQVWLYESHN